MAKPRFGITQRSRSNALLILFLIIGSALVAGLLFEDYREVPYGWFITIVWLVVAAFTTVFGIIYYAQFVLPHHEGENWLEGIAMMLRAATKVGSPDSAVQRTTRTAKLAAASSESVSSSFRTLNAGMVPSHQAIAVGKGNSYARAAGPGFVRLQSGDRPFQIIDLRRHLRHETETANTRDGIPLECRVTVAFQVKQSERDHEGDRLEYPYEKSAIFWVSQLNSIDQDNTARPWSEQVAPQAASYMISEIAQFTLDELGQSPAIFNGIQQRIRRQLRVTFDELGVNILSVKVAPVRLPEQIQAQRLANWRAPWESQILVQAAAGDAEALRTAKLARARAQVEIIEKTMRSIDEMRQAEGTSLPEIVTLRVIDVFEDAARKGMVQGYLPGQVLANIALDSPGQSQAAQGIAQGEIENGDS